MGEKAKRQTGGAFRKEIPPENAAGYRRHRFATSRRMRRLDRLEQRFAADVMRVAGAEASVLDAPCGSGRFFDVFRAAGRVTMLDFNQTMLDVIAAEHGGDGRLALVRGDCAALPFADGSFDLVFCMRLFHHLADDGTRRQVLGELSRVSRRHVALSYYDSLSWRYIRRAVRGATPSGHSIRLPRLLALAGQAGLRLVRRFPGFSFVEQQRMLLLEKDPCRGR